MLAKTTKAKHREDYPLYANKRSSTISMKTASRKKDMEKSMGKYGTGSARRRGGHQFRQIVLRCVATALGDGREALLFQGHRQHGGDG